MARKKRKKQDTGGSDGNVEMTPMIDVVFQLLIYFIVTITPVDVDAKLDVYRPAAGQPPPESSTPPKMIQIDVNPGTYILNGNSVSVERMEQILTSLGELSSTQTVMIKVARDARHERLITVLDRCSRAGLTNLSVASMN